MNKYLMIVIVALIAVCVVFWQRLGLKDAKIGELEQSLLITRQSLEILNNDVKGYQNAEKEKTKVINELRRLADSCYNTNISGDMLKRLHNK